MLGLGLREMLVLFVLLGVLVLIGALLWRLFRRSAGPSARLARLEELRSSGKITRDEYERQRANIITSI